MGSATAASARPVAGCKTVVPGAAWKIKGLGSGSSYSLLAVDMPCATARSWAVKLSHETYDGGAVKGPAGFKCVSTASKVSGDSRVYTGVCQKGRSTTSAFVWAPKP